MKVYRHINEFPGCKNAVVTTGTFDGLHIGHRTILNRIKELAKKTGGETVVLTFFPHPRMVLFPDNKDLKLIDTIDERIEFLEKEGIDHLIIHPFSKEFSRLSSVEFVREILVNKIGTKILVIGYNHQFGRNREGSFEHLKEYSSLYGFEVEEIPAKLIDDVDVSSTKIRRALLEGDIKTANTYLSRNFTLSGKVSHGNKIGREIGFPTANLHVKESYKIIPRIGVYAVKVWIDNNAFYAMLNIGYRPTFNSESNVKIEVHIFDFDKEIYDKNIKIEFVDRIRDEKKFNNAEELKSQLNLDKNYALKLLNL
ncbi:MAG: riboflavin biosynthesis protein [Bacteroidia bacterium]|nr:MAG: riboflavin biosynthesis protein [Bacteroidia bacterium]